VVADPAQTLGSIDRRIFGSFLEHLGRAIYGGIYDPKSKQSGPDGFRRDVLNEVKKLGVPIIRYPGGNFVSGHDWLSGVGPKTQRPRVLDRAWNSIETNQFGLNEFLTWCRLAGVEPQLGLNFGTGSAEMAAALVEYCNVEKGTRWSELRRNHGIRDPYRIKRWCLGNEMDGPWQIGHMTAREYGRKAADAARQMRAVDPDLVLVACGTSNVTMPSYLEWDREVLEECYAEVDAISLHRYFGLFDKAVTDDTSRFLAQNLDMERQIDEVAGVCDYVRARLRSEKRLWLSFDEWNVWYRETTVRGDRTEAPRLLEEKYDLRDALLVGGTLNSLIRKAERVRMACLAQLVNVIAPLFTDKDRVLRQTTFYPYSWALAHARGQSLDLATQGEEYSVPKLGPVSYLDIAGTFDADTGQSCLFILNRDTSMARPLEIIWREAAPTRVLAFETLTGNDLNVVNTFDNPNRVVPKPLTAPAPGAKMTIELPPRSYSVLKTASRVQK
jgi:alpha-N-arabinofuranosidase